MCLPVIPQTVFKFKLLYLQHTYAITQQYTNTYSMEKTNFCCREFANNLHCNMFSLLCTHINRIIKLV